MNRYSYLHQHLLLGNVSITVTRAPAAPAAEQSAPAAPAAEQPAPGAPEMTAAERARHMARVVSPLAIYTARELLGAGGKADNKRDAATLARRAHCAAEARIDSILLLGPPGV
jgi:hypothetical protein